MASNRNGGKGSSKEKMAAEEEKFEGVVAAVAVAGVAVLAAWGLSKLFGGGSERKMMKAPGQSHYMPRDEFEDDPAAYFRNLHHKK
ncbi:hypothetical protein CASFOL_020734 [Castilleja foliolosa]|uniref:Uncharacterized protein n=1 Tax=Castilleja foliolosa TaxID=1961234 RepID=A0ABD3D370_9LAMI